MELNESNRVMNVDILSSDPFVAVYDDIISEQECQHFIKISQESLKRSLVSDSQKGFFSDGRTSSNTWIKHDHDQITKNVGERIAKIVGIPLENAESFQVIYYGVSQEYKQHYDSWVHNGSEKTLRCMKWGGARMKTALCYLNNVPKGGGTKMTKLNIIVPAIKGNMLVFQNTISEHNHDRHELSEHAGLPVQEGEKYAFNLWFRECNSKRLYKDFNPEYYKPIIKEESVDRLNTWNIYLNIENSEKLHTNKDIFKISQYFDTDVISDILKKSNFNSRPRRDAWVKLQDMEVLINKIEQTTNINRKFYENINVVEYLENVPHNKHFNAYDLFSENGKKNVSVQGQRVFTMSLFLSDNFKVVFPSLNTSYNFESGDFLIYNNVIDSSLIRDKDLERIIVSSSGTGYLANIYVRAKSKSGDTLINDTFKNNLKPEITEIENYTNTLNRVFDLFKTDSVSRTWTGLDSFKYNFKGDFENFKKYISQYNDIRINQNCLNQENLLKNYYLDENLPIQVVNNVFDSKLLELIKRYYKETIENNIWVLGDKQAKRYKAHNEPMSRFLHYECLPLIERITGKSLKPTYTYLSAYVKGSDLPPHTDRPDCEYTVSFIVDKPDNTNWNIYVHRPQQSIKHKGRYEQTPPLDECEPVDCDAGGLMLFQGTDHIHFRNELKEDYYNVLLLHYCSL